MVDSKYYIHPQPNTQHDFLGNLLYKKSKHFEKATYKKISKCIFCGSPDTMTKEDFWPTWLRRKYPALSQQSVHIVITDEGGKLPPEREFLEKMRHLTIKNFA